MSELNSLADLFENELRDIYDAEHQIIKALPKVIDAVADRTLGEALQAHLKETHGQVKRLEQVFQLLEIEAQGRPCDGMAGILKNGAALIAEDGEEAVLDAAFISAAQRVEHYEITAYGALIAWAQLLAYDDVVILLNHNLEEEKAANTKLSQLAGLSINRSAAAAGEGPRPRLRSNKAQATR
jgi:ferritin-like metal-binding protein YciE